MAADKSGFSQAKKLSNVNQNYYSLPFTEQVLTKRDETGSELYVAFNQKFDVNWFNET